MAMCPNSRAIDLNRHEIGSLWYQHSLKIQHGRLMRQIEDAPGHTFIGVHIEHVSDEGKS